MSTVKFDLDKLGGEFKILNATNGGPWHTRHTTAHFRSNFEDYKADITAKENRRTKEHAIREFFKDAGISEKRIDAGQRAVCEW